MSSTVPFSPDVIDSALAFAIASYGRPASVSAVRTTSEPKANRKPRQAPKAPQQSGTSTVGDIQARHEASYAVATAYDTAPIPSRGTLSAKAFVIAMRRATSRQEKIHAMQAFQGYDIAGEYGSQELSAMMSARRELRPQGTGGLSIQEERNAKRSASGYVAGMPAVQRTRVQDLIRREKLSTDCLVDLLKLADGAPNASARVTCLGQVALEKARLTAIQAELGRLLG